MEDKIDIEVKEKNTKFKNKKIFESGADVLISSIISGLTVFFWYLTLIFGVYAIVRGVKSVKKNGSKLAKAGLIIAIISITVCVVIYTQLLATIIANINYL